jgi:hypothetical protein
VGVGGMTNKKWQIKNHKSEVLFDRCALTGFDR